MKQPYDFESLITEFKSDMQDFVSAKLENIQLRATQKGAEAAGSSVVGVLLTLAINLSLSTLFFLIIFALSLLFVKGASGYDVLQALTFGSLVVFAISLILIFILLAIKQKIKQKVAGAIITSVLNEMEEKEKAAAEEEERKRQSEYVVTTTTVPVVVPTVVPVEEEHSK